MKRRAPTEGQDALPGLDAQASEDDRSQPPPMASKKKPKKSDLFKPVDQHPEPDSAGRRLCRICRDGFTATQVNGSPIHSWCRGPWNGNVNRYMNNLARQAKRQAPRPTANARPSGQAVTDIFASRRSA